MTSAFGPRSFPSFAIEEQSGDLGVPFPFNGTIDSLSVELGPPQLLPGESKQAADAAAKARD